MVNLRTQRLESSLPRVLMGAVGWAECWGGLVEGWDGAALATEGAGPEAAGP